MNQINIKNLHYNQLKSLINYLKLNDIPLKIKIDNLFLVSQQDVSECKLEKEFIIDGK